MNLKFEKKLFGRYLNYSLIIYYSLILNCTDLYKSGHNIIDTMYTTARGYLLLLNCICLVFKVIYIYIYNMCLQQF